MWSIRTAGDKGSHSRSHDLSVSATANSTSRDHPTRPFTTFQWLLYWNVSFFVRKPGAGRISSYSYWSWNMPLPRIRWSSTCRKSGWPYQKKMLCISGQDAVLLSVLAPLGDVTAASASQAHVNAYFQSAGGSQLTAKKNSLSRDAHTVETK